MSRADQSFTRQRPNSCSSACAIGTGVAQRVARPHEEAHLHLVVERRGSGRRPASPRPAALVWPARPPHRRPARHDATRRGRGSRSAPTCSWAAAGCRAGTCCRRWSRGGPRRRSRCSRRSRPAAAAPPRPAGTRSRSPSRRLPRYAGESALEQRRSPAGAAPRQVRRPSAMSAFSAGAAHAPAAARRQPGEPTPSSWHAARSRIESPIAIADPRPSLAAVADVEDAERQVLDAGSRRGPRPTRPRRGARGRGCGPRRSQSRSERLRARRSAR